MAEDKVANIAASFVSETALSPYAVTLALSVKQPWSTKSVNFTHAPSGKQT